jgi:phospholipase/carboxylesterase
MNTTRYSLSELQSDSATKLGYRQRLPAPEKPTKLLLVLHGFGADETNFNLLNLADGIDPDTLVVLARGPLQLGGSQFAWFQVRFTANGPQISPQEAEHSRTLLIALLQQLQQQHGIAPERTVIAGFSQGGIMSASVALSSPESVKGFGLLSGRILPELEPVIAEKERLARLTAFVSHGAQDNTLPVHWAQRSDALLTHLGVPHSLKLYTMDHGISAEMQADFVEWLAA